MVTADLRRINLACGRDYRNGWLNVDSRNDKGRRIKPDKIVDLMKFPWPLESSYYEYVLVSHYIEHVPHTVIVNGVEVDALVQTMAEIQRILAPNGIVEIRVPDYRDLGLYFNTPTHYRIISSELLSAFHKRVNRGPAITFDELFFFEPVSLYRGPKAAGRIFLEAATLANKLKVLQARFLTATRLRPVPYELIVKMRKAPP